MVIVDTTVWVDYLRGTDNPHTAWLACKLSETRIGLTDLILCEVLQGVQEAAMFSRVRREMLTFEIFNTGGETMAIASAQNYRRLREQGHTVRKTIDCLIATFCLTQGHSLLHRDRDFDPFEEFLGLRVIHPAS